MMHLCRPEELLVRLHVLLPVEPDMIERFPDEILDGMGHAGGDDKILRLLPLQHQPHRLDVIPCKSPVSLRIEVSESELLRKSKLDTGHAVGDLPRDELES